MDSPSTRPWWSTGVFYQIYPRSFKDSTGNGIGDLDGILHKLDYLATLGVDAIWLNPMYPSPMADFGYDVSDYTGVDPVFGDIDSLRRLLAESHARDLKLILDYVPNHTSDKHPWFVESRASLDSPKRDWYIWSDPGPDGGPPNNWLSNFTGPAWTMDERTGQYYLHSFLKEQPDLNWRNPEVRKAMLGVLRFWLDMGVDGFRVDAILHLFKDPELRDNPPRTTPVFGKDRGDVATQEQLYNADQPELHEAMREMRGLFDSYPGDRMMVGEVYTLDPQVGGQYYGENDEFHLVHNLSMVNLPWDAAKIRRYVDRFEAALPPGAQAANLIGSHDESRVATRFGEPQARTAAVMLMTLRGTPFIYYGDELGMTDTPIPEDGTQDPWGSRSGLSHLSRDPARTPMPWTDEPGVGFSTPGSEEDPPEPWLPIHPEYARFNVQTQLREPGSMLNLYRRLIELRRSQPALTLGAYTPLAATPPGVHAYLREQDGNRILVALNFSAEPTALSLKEPGRGEVLLSSALDREEELDPGDIRLRGHEGLVVALIPPG